MSGKPRPPEDSPILKKFRQSMVMDLDKWRDGDGYDLQAFAMLTREEKQTILQELRAKPDLDWRDMEVLKLDNSAESFDRLRDELVSTSMDQRAHALGQLYETGRMNDSVFDHKLAQILDEVSPDDGLTHALLLAQDDPGPKTIAALQRGVRGRPPVALHFAAHLLDLAGLSDDMAAFDPKFRPTLLKLLPDEAKQVRAKAIDEVFAWLGSRRRKKE